MTIIGLYVTQLIREEADQTVHVCGRHHGVVIAINYDYHRTKCYTTNQRRSWPDCPCMWPASWCGNFHIRPLGPFFSLYNTYSYYEVTFCYWWLFLVTFCRGDVLCQVTFCGVMFCYWWPFVGWRFVGWCFVGWRFVGAPKCYHRIGPLGDIWCFTSLQNFFNIWIIISNNFLQVTKVLKQPTLKAY